MDGIILVNKPKNLTSHDIVQKIRILLNEKKAGHFGTLDPMATGLILIGIGKATKLFPFYAKLTKIYTGQIKLGYATDTYDSCGKATSEINTEYPSEIKIREIFKTFEGSISQVPPPYSAKKYKGKPLYKHARNNIKIKLPPNAIKIYFLNLLKYDPPAIGFETKCSSGTYIRSLAHEIGKKTGCGGHLSALKRTQIGSFSINDSLTLEEISAMDHKKRTHEYVLPLENLLPQFPKIILSEQGALKAKNGASIKPEDIMNIGFGSTPNNKHGFSENDQIFRLFSPEGQLIALATKKLERKGLHPFTVIDTGHNNQASAVLKGEHHE
ncbi:MAG TPA: tRNA pseudouridine(55) synthase TruB [Desulfobacterales bacterium]|nr:tRNA pseudouridine(55) synthase TruB [Desulfobacterales bacterium]